MPIKWTSMSGAPASPAKRLALILVSALSFATAAAATEISPSPNDLRLDPALRTEVTDSVTRHVEESYIFPDLARKLAAAIREHAHAGAYDNLNTGSALADRLTADLQSITPDRHLKVHYSAEPRPLSNANSVPSPVEHEQRRLNAIRQNFGIERVEHLDGNVGYLKLRKFEDPSLAGDTIVAAMQFLARTDALLIDLRQNGGGHGETVALLTSYLVDGEPIHLVDNTTRDSAETKQSWTLRYVPGPRYSGKPVFILTSGRTFSAAEQFAYTLQAMHRAVVVGERTRGGAHFAEIFPIGQHFGVMVPVGVATCPLTGTNWEGTGITPDVEVPADAALRTAHHLALQKLLETTTDDFADHLRTLISEMEAQL